MPRLWRIDRLRETNTEYVGVVTASDREAAVKEACEKFSIEPECQSQLVAREL